MPACGMDPFPHLFEPLSVGPARLRNRVIFGAHFTMFTEPNPVWGEPGFFGRRYGRYLAERWGLPEDLMLVAGRHHDPSEGAELDLLRIVHIACRIADCLGYEVSRPLVPMQMVELAFKREKDVFAPITPAARFGPDSPERAGFAIAKQLQRDCSWCCSRVCQHPCVRQ